MKFVIVLIALAMVSATFAFPASQVQEEEEQPQQQQQPQEVLSRVRRITCDLLSFSTKIGSLNHSACAAHCLAMLKGYRGGRCIDGVCNCRR